MRNPFAPTISNERLNDWFSQFEDSEKPTIARLVDAFQYYDPETINEKLRELHKRILDSAAVPTSSIFFVPVGYVAKSGSAITYFFKTQNDVSQEQFILPSDIETMIPASDKAFVFLDDYIGTGRQARQVWDGLASANPKLLEISKMIFASIVAREQGIEHLTENSGFEVMSIDVVKTKDIPLSDESAIFPSTEERGVARSILEKYGARLHPEAPLGYASSQGLLGFFYSTPNNTLPIFWSTEKGWNPLLPHKESFRDPASLFGPPSGLPISIRLGDDKKPLIETSQFSDYEINPEIAIQIFNEFRRVDVFLVLAPIIKTLGIEHADFSKFLVLINALKILNHEREPVSSSVVIAPDGCPPDAFGQVVVETDGEVSLDAMDKIKSMAPLLDGSKGAMVFDRKGRLKKTVLFRDTGITSYQMIPAEYHCVARTSLDTRGLVFYFSGDGRSSVFFRGSRILVYRGASWHLQPTDIEVGVADLANRASINVDALKHVFRLAAELSNSGHGGLLTVGDHVNVLKISERPETSHMVWPDMKVNTVATEAITGLMRQDGATIIDNEGNIVQGMTFLRPPVETEGRVEVGKGSKHSTASKVSGATDCVSLAISVDGQITVFFGGDIVLKLMG